MKFLLPFFGCFISNRFYRNRKNFQKNRKDRTFNNGTRLMASKAVYTHKNKNIGKKNFG